MPSKYFLGLEKARSKMKVMSLLKTEDGSMISLKNDILEEQKSFYAKLYTKDQKVSFSFASQIPHKITQEQRQLLEAELSVDEIASALRTTDRNKAPGPDGFTC